MSQEDNSNICKKVSQKRFGRKIVLSIVAILVISIATFAARTYINAKNVAKIVYQSSGIKKVEILMYY